VGKVTIVEKGGYFAKGSEPDNDILGSLINMMHYIAAM